MYLLDANTYIQAKNFHYQMTFCPAYWQWLDHQYESGRLGSISKVYDELAVYGDDLSAWVRDRREHFMEVSPEAIQDKFAEVAQHVAGLPGKPAANIADFLSGADPWLVAVAAERGATVVTHERLVDTQSKKIKIPNICMEFRVPYISTYELLNQLEAQFVLGGTP